MSRLQELLDELCPNGVEYKQIREIAWTGIGLATSVTKYKRENGVVLLHNSDIRQNRIELKNREFLDETFVEKNANKIHRLHDIITVHTGDVGTSAVIEEEYVGSIGFTTIITRINNFDEVYPYYLAHYLNSQLFKNEVNKKSISDRNNLNQKDFEVILVPIPPIDVQKVIVNILDKYTAVTEEIKRKLEEELLARKRQYEYYRNSYLTSVNAQERELGEVCEFIRGPFGGSLKKECFTSTGYAVYEQQHAIYSSLEFRYFINEEKYNELKRFEVYPNDLIVSCSGTIGKVFIIPKNAPKGVINQALLKLTPKENVTSEYIKWFFENTLEIEMNNSARGGAIKNVPSVAELKKIIIRVPSINEQKNIVECLEKLSSIYKVISYELESEIDKRQKQYEYYRDTLLSFKELTDGR